MTGLAISIPAKKVSAWLTETEPREAQAWLASLPYADSAEAAREIYQALYTLNRMELDPQERFELLELYRGPIDLVSKGLHSHFAHTAYPLSPRLHQLATFVRQLFHEMAAGYKCCLWGQYKALFPWGRKGSVTMVAERSIRYLSEVLMRSYRVYLPYPPDVWREINEIYRYAEDAGRHLEPIGDSEKLNDQAHNISQRYMQTALIGLMNPYQLPQDACIHVASFLERWVHRARILGEAEVRNPAGQFMVDVAADAPPVPFPRDGSVRAGGTQRVLNAIELVRVVHSFISRLQKGESARKMDLGFEQPDGATLELLQRMMRAWGLTARRRHSRIKRSSYVFLCVGINAVHFFASGQKPFTPPSSGPVPVEDVPAGLPPIEKALPPEQAKDTREGNDGDEAYVSLDDDVEQPSPKKTRPAPFVAAAATRGTELYRIDRWRVRDLGPRGMALGCDGGAGAHLRVGDLVGLQQVNAMGRWNVAVVRWLKTPEADSLDIGVELLGTDIRPAAVRRIETKEGEVAPYSQALWVPSIESLRQPATLLMRRGFLGAGGDLELTIESDPPRHVRTLQRGEHSNSFDQVVFAEVAHDED